MKKVALMLIGLFATLPGIAFAHAGGGELTGFMHGFGHPIGGLDHMLAMVAVGLWAAQSGGKASWVVPCTFVGVMVLGGILGFSGVSLPFVEEGILVSILILGVLIASAYKAPLVFSSLIVGLFAIFHGHAHGTEMPVSMSAATYAIGFALATAMLHFAGIGMGMLMKQANVQAVSRLAGGVIALGGVYLAIA
ncbi:HupE/UreJ family protein [Alkalimarinus alittae]|uniref:HupE/UreJ family protein n=1 Tax=Alkalimarinus alittae TaxID=2961619 RepID=A0ABY6N5U0_9ALTE|nr:HupE/UreJ family protein [Alkalimarinus alittae]UZE97496.1 HupE/UreJ family protein [Alkalimarinus alittae]